MNSKAEQCAMTCEYPKVSICMPIYNRNNFKPLIIYNLQNFCYPGRDKLELVIDDDGPDRFFKDNIELENFKKEVTPIRVKYFTYNKRRSIGVKRNNLVKLASHKHYAQMDSDDIYMPSYIQYSIETLKLTKKTLVGTNQMIFIYPLHKFKMTGIQCEGKRQIHEASMVFTKQHFRSMGGFVSKGDGASKGEGCKMVDLNDGNCGLTECHLVMMCVCHDSNTVLKDIFKDKSEVTGTLAPMLIDVLSECLIPENKNHQNQS